MNRAILPFAALLLLAPAAFAEDAPAPVTVTLPIGHAIPPDVMTYSPDGRFLLAGDYADEIKLWDAGSGELVRSYGGHAKAITALAFSPDGAYFASGSDDDTVRIWNVATGKVVNTLTEHTASIDALAFAPNGLMLASGDDDGKIILQDFSPETKGGRTAKLPYAVMGLKIDTAANLLVALCEDDTVETFDLATLESTGTFGPGNGSAGAAIFVPNSTRILLGDYKGALSLWDYKTGGLAQSFAMTPKLNEWALAFPDGKRFLTGAASEDDDSGDAIVWNGDTGIEAKRIDFKGDVHAIAPGGKTVALADSKGIWIQDAETGAVVKNFASRTLAAAYQSATADGAYVLSTFPQTGTMALWNIDTGATVRTFDESGGPAWISPDGTRIVGAPDPSGRGAVRVWDADSGEVLATFDVGAGEVRKVGFSADGKLALALVGESIRTLDMTALDALGTGPKVEGARQLYVAPDGKAFVAADNDGVPTIWTLADGKAGKPLAGLAKYTRFAWSPDGKTLLGGDGDGTVVLWNAKTGKVAKTLKTGAATASLGFSPDGAMIYAAGWDGGLRLWNLKTGKALAPMMHDAPPDLVRFAKDGKTIVTTPGNSTALRWSLKSGALLTTTARLADGTVVTVTPEGFLDGNGDVGNPVRLVRGLDVYPPGKALAQLQRPDVVAAKIAGDEAIVKAAAKSLDLNVALDSAVADADTSARATHVVIARVTLHEKPDATAAEGADLTPGMQVAVVEADGPWTLVARDGKPIGYVTSDAIAPLQ